MQVFAPNPILRVIEGVLGDFEHFVNLRLADDERRTEAENVAGTGQRANDKAAFLREGRCARMHHVFGSEGALGFLVGDQFERTNQAF